VHGLFNTSMQYSSASTELKVMQNLALLTIFKTISLTSLYKLSG